jgi:hypothetical protein
MHSQLGFGGAGMPIHVLSMEEKPVVRLAIWVEGFYHCIRGGYMYVTSQQAETKVLFFRRFISIAHNHIIRHNAHPHLISLLVRLGSHFAGTRLKSWRFHHQKTRRVNRVNHSFNHDFSTLTTHSQANGHMKSCRSSYTTRQKKSDPKNFKNR